VQATMHHRLRDAGTGGVIAMAGQQEQHGAGRQQFAKAKLKRSPIF
jgi:23S rRNA-/tRNA-specific pseudouridylate synthase